MVTKNNIHTSLRINQMNLRLPGHTSEAGSRVARSVGHRLAELALAGAGGRIGSLDLKVTARPGASEAELSESISRAISRAIEGGRRG